MESELAFIGQVGLGSGVDNGLEKSQETMDNPFEPTTSI